MFYGRLPEYMGILAPISAAIAFSAPDHHRDKNVHSGQQIYLLPSCDSSAKADNNDD